MDCDCQETFVVSADMTKLARGEFYGQLNVKDRTAHINTFTDSCIYEAS